MASVFLSYDRDDARQARPIASALEKAGHSVWWDKHIGGGTEYSKEIEQALNSADVVVVLWSSASVESPWVRDEAGSGRDRARLVPLALAGTSPPLGFRQYQAIDLGDWKGRGKVPRLADVLAAIERQSREPGVAPAPKRTGGGFRLPAWAIASVVLGLIVIAALIVSRPWDRSSSGGPRVSVVAADASARSRAAASDLLVKLGGLAQVGDGKWQLVDAAGKSAKADLIFRTADTGTEQAPKADLVLIDGKSKSLLWSRELTLAAGEQADLRQQLSLIAGKVLGCALESRGQGLAIPLLRLFLNACAPVGSDGGRDGTQRGVAQLRSIVQAAPKFQPAWSRLMLAEAAAADDAKFSDEYASAVHQLENDAGRARAIFPDLPELAVADLQAKDRIDYGQAITSLSKAVERAPNNVPLLTELSNAFQRVGRMDDAISSAKKAAELDPLSPAATGAYIMTLAYGGQVETARRELAKAEKFWAGTAALKDAELAFMARFGDPAEALKLDSEGYNTKLYYEVRTHPTPANIARLKHGIDEFRPKQVTPAQIGWAIQGLAEFGLVDDVFYWLDRIPTDQGKNISYILFRPALASARRDPRFMPFASRIGLVRYWRESGKWPDFCQRPGIPYDCRKAAAETVG